jgi:hypothetical protein
MVNQRFYREILASLRAQIDGKIWKYGWARTDCITVTMRGNTLSCQCSCGSPTPTDKFFYTLVVLFFREMNRIYDCVVSRTCLKFRLNQCSSSGETCSRLEDGAAWTLCSKRQWVIINVHPVGAFCVRFLIVEVWGGVVVKTLSYKSESPGIDSRRGSWGFFPRRI